MAKIFPIGIILVAVIGFSSSAYLFSESDISIKIPISIETQNNSSVIQEIERCIEQNLLEDSTITLNSFNTNMLLTMKEAASEAQSNEELKQIKQKLYKLTNCTQ
jgi:sugar (pentulose or hexulose) kinase